MYFSRLADFNVVVFLQIVEMCLKYITHDPNYNYDDYEDDEGQMDMDEDDDGEEDDEYSDDDDMSWKVRFKLLLLKNKIKKRLYSS